MYMEFVLAFFGLLLALCVAHYFSSRKKGQLYTCRTTPLFVNLAGGLWLTP